MGGDLSADNVLVLCRVAEQLRGLPDTVSSALVNAAAASSKAFEAKVQAEEAVELAESRGLNVTKAKEAAVRATLAAEAAATAASNVEINAANIAAFSTDFLETANLLLFEVSGAKDVGGDVRIVARRCTGEANFVTVASLTNALDNVTSLYSVYGKATASLSVESVALLEELKMLEDGLKKSQVAVSEAADAADQLKLLEDAVEVSSNTAKGAVNNHNTANNESNKATRNEDQDEGRTVGNNDKEFTINSEDYTKKNQGENGDLSSSTLTEYSGSAFIAKYPFHLCTIFTFYTVL
ncbi:BARP protein [Trypanosoma brucei gambiense DAL972]|uniref:BARP protein n=1 Tax=Trypanosoma brucei gambiense (strain MHOM/CI/86/DAL972) TaxID=679716 RepID=C9ZZP6_TRYB9|nr:BARP protein [Trypanosoma brucei gambiense DAL972]CBH14895.1 BARP protein [Trypanosoma brucei gambiense DAL972]|eukprot:XP_011777161.1 BARP protein [Trypanosoma brucei gambiense DAL972]